MAFLRKTAHGSLYLNYYRRISNVSVNKEIHKFDLIVVGGGIVGTATARELKRRHKNWKIAILEKEAELALHQSGHNSGVIHAGIYYKPGSLKAKLCVEGMKLMYEYLDTKHIPYRKCGKLIVATNESEIQQLMELYHRGLENNVPDLEIVDHNGITNIEPQCAGLKALWSPQTGIVDYKKVVQEYVSDFEQDGGKVFLNSYVKCFEENETEYPITIKVSRHYMCTKYVLTCAGLYSDKLAEITGCPRSPSIIPFRGEYLLLSKELRGLINTNVYPVPNSKFPFLGVHFTPRMDGSVWIGPNAVLAFKREGYKWWHININELIDCLRYPGFIRLATKYWKFGLEEIYRSSLKSLQIEHIQRYFPRISEYDLEKGPSGVRAQAVDNVGTLVDDFVFDYGSGNGPLAKRVMHCRNVPSPGATSSLAIAKMISDKVDKEFQNLKILH